MNSKQKSVTLKFEEWLNYIVDTEGKGENIIFLRSIILKISRELSDYKFFGDLNFY